MHKSVREFEGAMAAAVTERRELAAMIGTMHGKWKQWEWLGWTGIGAFFLGLLISPMFARVLPFGWDGHVAAFIMNADRWRAGSALMKARVRRRGMYSWSLRRRSWWRTTSGVSGLSGCGGENEERTALQHRRAGAVKYSPHGPWEKCISLHPAGYTLRYARPAGGKDFG